MFWNNSAPRRGATGGVTLREGGDDAERCEGGNENSTAAEEAVVAVDTVKRPSGSITRAYVRERRTREECFFMAREKSQQRLARVMRRTTDEEKRSGGY